MIRTSVGQDVSDAGGVVESGLDFDDFARSRQAHLRRSAHLLCGDWHLAEDLTQTALAKLYAVWRRVRQLESPDGYARRVLYRTFIDETRRRRWWERAGALQEDVVAPASDPDLRLTLLDALRQLPPRGRAVLVLRFWEDQSVEATAAALGCSVGTVKSQTSRGLGTLRRILADSGKDLGKDFGTGSGAAGPGPRPGTEPATGTGTGTGNDFLRAEW
ncbi:SigE family RNA polymerase sigma factor [Streptomyces sp. W16]|uniref:SigE family RNA polymerase sigma factor n=1 Tax=Streptomyces sp. W16 TaxID=3076631 RepID=UPI00295BADC3|nr:SigE family RNA polymerase sigma factor [Streptomyces sp. W16]MDV9171017.1 SigE family RNA polymerase sigma factor [Streptomyces sp. W16]